MIQTPEQERPCIHVALLPGVDVNLYRWVQIGAEEEGVPCRKVDSQESDAIANAFTASQSSKFNIGVAVGPTQVVLHESHMPPNTPVLAFDVDDNQMWVARLMGCNAARMIIRKPFRFEDEAVSDEQLAVSSQQSAVSSQQSATSDQQLATNDLDPAQLKAVVTVIVRKILERGMP